VLIFNNQLRINMTLVSASDGAVRWTEKYDRPITNVFAVQDEIARTVAGTLLGSLRGSSNTPGPRAETSDPEAHALFLQGQLLFNRRGAPALRYLRRGWRRGLLGGACSLAAYAIVLFAMTRAPVAAVAALRETSVLFAALIGAVWLEEGFGAMRFAGAASVVVGVAALKL